MTKVKFASNIDLEKKQSVENSIMQTFATLETLNTSLSKDGMYGYLKNVGIYLNINGTNVKIADINDATDPTNVNTSKIIYSGNTPPSTGLEVSFLWFDTSILSLKIWNGSAWIPTQRETPLINVYNTQRSYSENELVIYNNNIYKYSGTTTNVGGGGLPNATNTLIFTNKWINISFDNKDYFDSIKPLNTNITYPIHSMFVYKDELYITNKEVLTLVEIDLSTGQPQTIDVVFNNLKSSFINLSNKSSEEHLLPKTIANGGTIGNISVSADGKSVNITHTLNEKYPTVILVDTTTKEQVNTTVIYENDTTVKLRFSNNVQSYNTDFMIVLKK